MNKIWSIICLVCIATLVYISPTEVLPSLLKASSNAVELSFTLCAGYAIWLGFYGIIAQTKIPKCLSKLLSPLIDLIYGKTTITKETKNFIALSMATNMLGIGSASTPMSIKAVESMYKGSDKATFPMVMLVVISATGLQLLPTSILSLLASFGDSNPAKIILPTLISSLISTIIGILLVKIFVKKEKL